MLSAPHSVERSRNKRPAVTRAPVRASRFLANGLAPVVYHCCVVAQLWTLTTMSGRYHDPSESAQPYRDPTPLPDNVPKVQELGVTSAPLKSAAFFLGAYCKDYNGT